MRPRLLDLFCGEGGASEGYHRAGFEVVGVDHRKITRYPHEFVCADALRFLADHGHEFHAIHASPPCQLHSKSAHLPATPSGHARRPHPDLLAPTRKLLLAVGRPYVIENVPGAPLVNPLTLCGASFGLTATDTEGNPLVLKRHRLFESNVWLWPRECACRYYADRGFRVGGAYGGGRMRSEELRPYEGGTRMSRAGYTPRAEVQRVLMRTPWMSAKGLQQAIPPAYTEHLGAQLLDELAEAGVTSAPIL